MTSRALHLARLLAVLTLVVLILRVAWITDDALITLRTALNLTHGWGAGYNASEAVQGYTHPLWFLLWAGVGTATNQWIIGVIGLSVALAGVAVALVAHQARSIGRLVVVIGLLAMSNAFVEYATSGLENPLAFALLAALMTFTVSPTAMGDIGSTSIRSRTPWAALIGLLAAAVVLTRFDLVLILAPVAFAMAVSNRRRWKEMLIGLIAFGLPVVAWFSWSWATYHTLLPNTFLAKRNVDIPQFELIVQGVRYLWVSLLHDPATAVLLATGLGAALAFGGWLLRSWAVGAIAYIGYVVWIGGDFMAWRFLSVPAVVAAFLLAASPIKLGNQDTDRNDTELARMTGGTVVMIGVLMVAQAMNATPTSLSNPQKQRWEWDQNLNGAVADERGYYVPNGMTLDALMNQLSLAYTYSAHSPFGDGTGLFRPLRGIDYSAREWPVNEGDFALPTEVGVTCGGTGNVGISVGPTVHLVDPCALTDRFLASQTYQPAEPFAWRMGHFHRDVPEGYVDAIRTNDPLRMVDMADRHTLTELWKLIR